MRSLNPARIWLVGAAVVGLLLIAATYLLVVSPARSDAAAVRSQTDDATLAQATLRHKLRDLEAASKDLGTLQAAGTAAAAAIPVTPDTQGLLRQVQAAAAANRVTVGSVAIAEATTTDVDGVWALPVTLALDGAPTDLVAVVAALQGTTGRALTITGTTVDVVADSGASLTLDVRMYCSTDPGVVGSDPVAAGGTSGTSGTPAPAAGPAATSGTGTTSAS